MFRHTFAKKWLLDCNGNAFTLQKMLGHSTMEMTRHYTNIWDADLANNYVSPLEKLQRKQATLIQQDRISYKQYQSILTLPFDEDGNTFLHLAIIENIPSIAILSDISIVLFFNESKSFFIPSRF